MAEARVAEAGLLMGKGAGADGQAKDDDHPRAYAIDKLLLRF